MLPDEYESLSAVGAGLTMTLQFEILFSGETVPFASLDSAFPPWKSMMCRCYTAFLPALTCPLDVKMEESLSPLLPLHFPSLQASESHFHSPGFVSKHGDVAGIVSVTSMSLKLAIAKSHSLRTTL